MTTEPVALENEPKNEYIGRFTNEKIQASIDRVLNRLDPKQSGLVMHLDGKGNASVSLVQRLGDHISVEAAMIYDGSIFGEIDRDKLAVQAELIAKW